MTAEGSFIWKTYTVCRWDGTNEADVVAFMNEAAPPIGPGLPRYSISSVNTSEVIIYDELNLYDLYLHVSMPNVIMEGAMLYDFAPDERVARGYYTRADMKDLLPGLLLDGKSTLVEIVTELDAEDSIEVPFEWSEDLGRSDYRVIFAPDAALLGKVSFSVKDDLTKTATGMTIVVTAIDDIDLVLSGAVHCQAVTP